MPAALYMEIEMCIFSGSMALKQILVVFLYPLGQILCKDLYVAKAQKKTTGHNHLLLSAFEHKEILYCKEYCLYINTICWTTNIR